MNIIIMKHESKMNSIDNFPLSSVEEVIRFLKYQICEKNDPDVDLVLISIILGFLENRLTGKDAEILEAEGIFPTVTSDDILPLVDDFRQYIRNTVTPKTTIGSDFTDRQTIKDVANAVWKRLSKSVHKDKLHFQTLYTFKNGSHLDCFGLAYAVAAGCQVLGCNDVHLCLSEDHAWIAFGPDGSETAEITWNGKQNEAYRGESIDSRLISQKNWLYLGGNPIVCKSRRLEATAAVAMISPRNGNKDDSYLLSRLQQGLLWMLYDCGYLSGYPMALCILAELQERLPRIAERPGADELFQKAIDCSRSICGDSHVYPYTEYGCYACRKQQHGKALLRWQQAANVLRKYCYNREEEELHKEISKIANDLIPDVFKSISESSLAASFFQKKDNLINLLLFYDGIAEWEQNGTTPIFHNFWVKPFTQSISYFDYDTRMAVLSPSDGSDDDKDIILPSPLPQSPMKNMEAYRRSLVSTVLNVYGKGETIEGDRTAAVGGDGAEKSMDEFVRCCETNELKADVVWNPNLVGDDPLEPSSVNRQAKFQLQLSSRKMNDLRRVLTKRSFRAADVELVLCAQLETACGSGDGRRGAKRQRIG